MKKVTVIFLLAISILSFFGGMLPQSGQAETEEHVEIVLHKRIYRDVRAPEENFYKNDGLTIKEDSNTAEDRELIEKTVGLNGANFEVFDATTLYNQTDLTSEKFVETYSKMSRKEAKKIAKEENLLLVGKITTQTDEKLQKNGIARIQLPNQKGNAYLFIETKLNENKQLNVDLDKKAAPLMVVLPQYHPINHEVLKEIHLYPKNVGYVRDPYFFKYGKTSANDLTEGKPIQGAKFVIFQYDKNNQKIYLDMSPVNDLQNTWVASNDPLNDIRVNKFMSDQDGLVNTGERFLPSGTYYFEEVEAAPGFVIDSAAQKIKIEIPEAWYDEKGVFQPVMINGQEMDELISGKVPASAYHKKEPRVYNYQVHSALSNNLETGGQLPQTLGTMMSAGLVQTLRQNLPKTNEGKSILFALGLGIIVAVIFSWNKKLNSKKVNNK